MSLVTFHVDKALYQAILDAANEKAAAAVAEDAFKASQRYIKVGDTKLLRNSGRIVKNGSEFSLEWETPYALRQYYTGTPRTTENPNASLMWAHKAESLHKSDWLKIFTKAFAGSISK